MNIDKTSKVLLSFCLIITLNLFLVTMSTNGDIGSLDASGKIIKMEVSFIIKYSQIQYISSFRLFRKDNQTNI